MALIRALQGVLEADKVARVGIHQHADIEPSSQHEQRAGRLVGEKDYSSSGAARRAR